MHTADFTENLHLWSSFIPEKGTLRAHCRGRRGVRFVSTPWDRCSRVLVK